MSAFKFAAQALIIVVGAMLLFDCGRSGANKALPKPLDQLRPEDTSEEARERQARWDRLADQLGVHNNLANGDLQQKLIEPSSLLTTRREELKGRLDRLGKEWGSDFARLSCEKIEAVAEMAGNEGDPRWLEVQSVVGGESYTFLVATPVVPPAEANPLLLYAHSGVGNVELTELRAMLAGFLKSHVVIAPSFGGTSLISGDAASLLAAHQCVLQALAGVQGGDAANRLRSAVLESNLRFVGGESALARVPATIVVGLGRGGSLAMQAAARSAVQLKLLNSGVPEKNGLGMPQPISCLAAVNAMHTLTMAEARLALELAVKQQLQFSSFGRSPAFAPLAELTKAYATSGSENDLEALAQSIVGSDATLFSPLLLGGIRNWRTQDRGALLIAHSEGNRIVPVSQASIASAIIGKQLSTPGIEEVLGANPPSFTPAILPTVEPIDNEVYLHSDAAFFSLLSESGALASWRDGACEAAL